MLAAASSKVKFAGMVATDASSGIVRYSACAPNRPSIYPNTLSPTSKEVTPLPTASTSPANSVPRTLRFGLTSPVRNLKMKGLAAR